MSPVFLKRLSDERLGGCLAKGEAAAFDELYRRYSHRLAVYAGNLLDDPAAGDDVAQTALLKAYQALRAGNVPGAVRPWLYRIAHNAAIDLALRRRELPSAELPEGAAERPLSAPLVAAIATLTDHQRRVYVLRELHGLRIDETAHELGLTAAQVEQALFAARNRLAEHLVFGERLGCPSVRRLAAGPLDPQERRAIKAHLRACRECRGGLGGRGAVLTWFPVLPLDWLRSALTLGGAPAATKIGAVVAATTLAVGVPVAVQTHELQLTRAHHPVVRRTVAISPAAHRAQQLAVAPLRLTEPVFLGKSTPTAHLAGHTASGPTGAASDNGGGTDGGGSDGGGHVNATGSGDGTDAGPPQADGGQSVTTVPAATGNGSDGSGSNGSGSQESSSGGGDSGSGSGDGGPANSGPGNSGDGGSGGSPDGGSGGSPAGGSLQGGD